MKSYGPTASPIAEATSAPAVDADTEIEETDIRILSFYGDGENDGQTLVGLGPPSSRSPVALPATTRTVPRSEPPGPWGSDEEGAIPPSFRLPKAGIWAAAVPLLLVVAAAFVIALRGLAPTRSHATPAGVAVTEPPAREGTGLFVRLANAEVRVMVDGIDQGPPPVLVMDLEPGSHAIVVSGPDYVRYEQTITLIASHVSTLEPTLERLTASVPPAAVESASRAESQQPEGGVGTRVVPGATASGHGVRGSAGAVKPVPVDLEETPENPYSPSSAGVLAASSSPSASVIVDGRPVGKSPRVLDLTPGTHTIAFVHPTEGRKSMTVNIKPGQTTNVAVEF